MAKGQMGLEKTNEPKVGIIHFSRGPTDPRGDRKLKTWKLDSAARRRAKTLKTMWFAIGTSQLRLVNPDYQKCQEKTQPRSLPNKSGAQASIAGASPHNLGEQQIEEVHSYYLPCQSPVGIGRQIKGGDPQCFMLSSPSVLADPPWTL